MTSGRRNIGADWPGLEGIWVLWLAEPGGNGVLIGGNEEAWRRAWLRQSKHKTKRPKRIEHTQSLYLIYHSHTHTISFTIPRVHSYIIQFILQRYKQRPRGCRGIRVAFEEALEEAPGVLKAMETIAVLAPHMLPRRPSHPRKMGLKKKICHYTRGKLIDTT